MLEQTLEVIEGMKKAGIVSDYVLMGSVAASLYVEPVSTLDMDVLVPLASSLTPLREIYEYLKDQGYPEFDEKGHILIGEWPVDFLPEDNDALTKEMFATARSKQIGKTPCRVALPEYLAAEAVKVGRLEKDVPRLIELFKYPTFDKRKFERLIEKFGLQEKWLRMQSRLS